MYQAGIKQITLYENKDITFRFYDPLNLSAITEIMSTGAQVLVQNLQRPEFEINLKIQRSGKVGSDYSLSFLLLELSLENYETIFQLKTSIYGWCFLVEFYSGDFRFFHVPVYCKESDIKPHKDMAFTVKMQTATPSTRKYYDYDPDVSIIPVYRFDTTLISWDNDILTWDYEL